MKTLLPLPAIGGLLLLAACAEPLSLPNKNTDSSGETTTPPVVIPLPGPGGAQARFSKSGDDLYTGQIDASGGDWIYIDLDTQTQVTPATPANSSDWDIAFNGNDIKLNGGSSGAPPSGRAVKIYGDKVADGTAYPFAQLDAAPTETAVQYQTDSTTAAGPLDNALNPLSTGGKPAYAFTQYPDSDQSPNQVTGAGDYGWYRNAGLLGQNAISPRVNVAYIVYSVECRYYRLRLLASRDASGNAKHPRFEFGEIPGPECAGTGGATDSSVAPLGRAVFTNTGSSQKIAIDASDSNAWVFVDLGNARQVAPSNPGNDPLGWDIAFKRSDIKVNGGANGSGIVAIADGYQDNWDQRTAAYADPSRYHTDTDSTLAFTTYPAATDQPSAACGNINGDFGWYYYSGFCSDGGSVHQISPRDVVYVVKGHDGKYWKFRMLGYYDSSGTSAHPSAEYAPVTAP